MGPSQANLFAILRCSPAVVFLLHIHPFPVPALWTVTFHEGLERLVSTKLQTSAWRTCRRGAAYLHLLELILVPLVHGD